MPDITMCKGEGCPLADACYRYTAEPDLYQGYFIKEPWQPSMGRCDFYTPDCPRPEPEDVWKEERQ